MSAMIWKPARWASCPRSVRRMILILLGGSLAVVGAIAAALLVREREIERAPFEPLPAQLAAAA
jgi:hypothetical protein